MSASAQVYISHASGKELLNLSQMTNFKLFQTETVCSSSKLEEFADDIFKFDGNGRKFFKHKENNNPPATAIFFFQKL